MLLYDIAYDIIYVLLGHLRMGKKEKLDIKIETIPIRSDISFQELENYLSNHGFTAKKRTGTSHVQFAKPGHIPITIPCRSPVLAAYVRQAVNAAHDND